MIIFTLSHLRLYVCLSASFESCVSVQITTQSTLVLIQTTLFETYSYSIRGPNKWCQLRGVFFVCFKTELYISCTNFKILVPEKHGQLEAASPAQPSPVSIFYRVLLSAVPSAPSRTDSMSHFPSDFTPTDFLKELLDTWAHSFYTQKKPSLSSASGIPKSPGKRKNISLPLTSEMIQPGIPELPSLASAQWGCGIFPATCWLAGLQPGWMAPLSPNVFQSLLLLFRSL